MATATNTKSVSSFGRIRIIVDQYGQNQRENRTRFRVRFVLLNDAQNRSFNNNNISKSISGSARWSGSGPFNVPANGSQTIIDREFVVNHNSDGTLTVTFKGTLGSTGTSTFGSGGSVSVSLEATRILRGAWVRTDGSWKLAVPYVRSGGSWKAARPYVRHSGSWKETN